jgi:amino acid transporter
LGLWDTVSIIIGIVIGSSIFETAPAIFENVYNPWQGLGIWLFCGVLSFIGALCYAELATTYPRHGGDYVYLTRGLDRPMGFLFGWSQLAVILSGSTGAMAFIFGQYSAGLMGINANEQYAAHAAAEEMLKEREAAAVKMIVGERFTKDEKTIYLALTEAKHADSVKLMLDAKMSDKEKNDLSLPARKARDEAAHALEARQGEVALFAIRVGIGAVVVLTLINLFGIVLGKWVQNILVVVKLAGLALIVVAGVMAWQSDAFHVAPGTAPPSYGGISVAIILVLYAFGGWNDAAFVAADLKDRRNIPKALLLGTLGITGIYLLVNFAYVVGMGYETARNAYPNIAAHLLRKAFGEGGSQIISVIVMISALGAINGLIFTGSRVYLSLGKEHRVFSLLGQWNATLMSPIWSLLAQAAVTILMMLAVGTVTARDVIDATLGWVNLKIDWSFYRGGFFTLFAGTAPVFWIFFLMTGFAMFALRARDPNIERPFILRAPWYPFLPMIFCGMCLFGFYAAMRYAGWVSLLGFIPLFLGLPLYWLSGSATEAPREAGPRDDSPALPELGRTPDDAIKHLDR